MTFRVGIEVECINIDPLNVTGVDGRKRVTTWIRLGGIYTIRWVGDCPFEPWREFGLNLRFIGIVRPDHENPEWCDFPFAAFRFRPLTESKSNISFTTGADPSTDQFDNRRKVQVRA